MYNSYVHFVCTASVKKRRSPKKVISRKARNAPKFNPGTRRLRSQSKKPVDTTVIQQKKNKDPRKRIRALLEIDMVTSPAHTTRSRRRSARNKK